MHIRLTERISKVILFFAFVFIILFKAVSFHYFAFHSIPISSLWTNPGYFFLFYAQKVSFPVIIGSIIFLFRKYWWTIGVSVFCDLWCISNLIYYKIFDSFLTIDTIFMASNMAGGWSSILSYINYQEFVFVFSTVLFVVLLFLVKKHTTGLNSHYILFASVLLFGIALNNCINVAEIKKYQKNDGLVFEFEKLQNKVQKTKRILTASFPELYIFHDWWDTPHGSWREQHVLHKSIISYFLADLSLLTINSIKHNTSGQHIILSSKDIEEILLLTRVREKDINPTGGSFAPNQIILILVESLESWIFEKDIEGQNIMPNLRKLIEENHTLYCHKIKSQTLAGNSGDGQMIINTGLLPISSGVACMDYSDDVYPNLAHSFPFSTIVNPWPEIWNQDKMTKKYSFRCIVQPNDEKRWNDEEVFSYSQSVIDSTGTPQMLMILTLSSHAPFNTVDEELSFSRDTPKILGGYLNCLHYTDTQIGVFIDYLQTNDKFKNTTIVITGDHTIFKSSMLAEFSSFAQEQSLSIASNISYCPLIIYSPSQIHENKKILEEECYQMDIFPTIQKLIGDEINPWRGLGVNLLDTCSLNNRRISEEKAYEISEKIIRSDFFRHYADYVK